MSADSFARMELSKDTNSFYIRSWGLDNDYSDWVEFTATKADYAAASTVVGSKKQKTVF